MTQELHPSCPWLPATSLDTPFGCRLATASSLPRLDLARQVQLGDQLLAGMTLVVVVDEPEMLTKAPLATWIGGSAAPVGLTENLLSTPSSPGLLPSLEVARGLSVSLGGNLVETPWGAGASYGLGSLQLLAFDPRAPAVHADAWVEHRETALFELAADRTALFASHPARPKASSTQASELAALLEVPRLPPGTLPWLGLMLVLWAVGYFVALRRPPKRPSRDLLTLLGLSSVAVLALLLVVSLRGALSPQHSAFSPLRKPSVKVSYVEVGAGLARGHAITWSTPSGSKKHLAEPELVRQQTMVDLGGSIALFVTDSAVLINNDSTLDLQHLFVFDPRTCTVSYLPELRSGTNASLASARSLFTLVRVPPNQTATSLELFRHARDLGAEARDATLLYQAVASALGPVGWWPSDVPSLISLTDGVHANPNRGTAFTLTAGRTVFRVVGQGRQP